MTPVDWLIVCILAVSTLFSLLRGFVKEALSLAVWISAFIITYLFADALALLWPATIEGVALRSGLAMLVLFLGTFIVGTIVKQLIGKFIKAVGLSGLDRVLGMAFGLLRGLLIIFVVMTLVKSLVSVEQQDWWQASLLIGQLELLQLGFLQLSQ